MSNKENSKHLYDLDDGLEIGFSYLKFICYLTFEICDFLFGSCSARLG